MRGELISPPPTRVRVSSLRARLVTPIRTDAEEMGVHACRYGQAGIHNIGTGHGAEGAVFFFYFIHFFFYSMRIKNRHTRPVRAFVSPFYRLGH